MKNLKKLLTAGISFIALPAFAATDYYYVGLTSMNPHTATTWEGEALPPRGGTGNWIFDGDYVAAPASSFDFWSDHNSERGNTDIWNIGSMQFKGNLTRENWSIDSGVTPYISLRLKKGSSTTTTPWTMTIGSFEKQCKLNVQITPTYSTYTGGFYYSLNITGNVNCTSNESTTGATYSVTYFGGWNNGTSNNSSTVMFDTATIGGLLTIGYTEGVAFMAGKYSKTLAMMDHTVGDVNLNGGVQMKGNSTLFLQHSDKAYNAVIRLNGLNGAGFVKNGGGKNTVDPSLSMLVFTNTKDASFNGHICNVSNVYDTETLLKTKVVMAAANGVTQSVSSTQYFTGGVEVISGNLRFDDPINNIGNLTMRGGSFGVNKNGNGEGYFENCMYYGGTIFFVANGNSIDQLDFAGTFTKDSSTDKILMDFDLSNVNIGYKYEIIRWNDYSGLSESDFAFESSQYSADFEMTDTELYVTFGIIPEPSTFAVILGFAALATAVLRRQKP